MKRVILLAIFVGCLNGCGEVYRYFESGEVGWALKKAIRNEHKQEVVLKELTRFSWDEFWVFDPYTPKDVVCNRLALTPTECKETIKTDSTDDGEMLIVFRNQQKVVHAEIHFRWHGDFTPAPDKPFTPASAVFLVLANGKGADGRQWLRLRPKDVQAQP